MQGSCPRPSPITAAAMEQRAVVGGEPIHRVKIPCLVAYRGASEQLEEASCDRK